jgi:hypothetical protein
MPAIKWKRKCRYYLLEDFYVLEMPNIKWTTLLNIHGPSKGTLERFFCLFYFIKIHIIFKLSSIMVGGMSDNDQHFAFSLAKK